MTVSDLIDYLQQFPVETTVVLTVGDIEKQESANHNYIVLEYLDFSGGEEASHVS